MIEQQAKSHASHQSLSLTAERRVAWHRRMTTRLVNF
jgi:hypothetical protein